MGKRVKEKNAVQSAAELPDLPEDDGTYMLQVVIDEGEATFSWEAVSAGE
jgi:hypothetical protein